MKKSIILPALICLAFSPSVFAAQSNNHPILNDTGKIVKDTAKGAENVVEDAGKTVGDSLSAVEKGTHKVVDAAKTDL